MNNFRSIIKNNERRWGTDQNEIYDDLLQVGSLKSLGYYPFDLTLNDEEYNQYATKLQQNGFNVKDFYNPISFQQIEELRQKLINKNIIIRTIYEPKYKMKIIWAGHQKMMQDVLDQHIILLDKNNLPIQATDFFNFISINHISHKDNEDLYHLICDLFNSWCLFCDKNCIHRSDNRGIGEMFRKDYYYPNDKLKQIDNNILLKRYNITLQEAMEYVNASH